jgi:hypothetical protein
MESNNASPTLRDSLTLSAAKEAALAEFHDHGGDDEMIECFGNGGLAGYGPAYFGLSPQGGGGSAA